MCPLTFNTCFLFFLFLFFLRTGHSFTVLWSIVVLKVVFFLLPLTEDTGVSQNDPVVARWTSLLTGEKNAGFAPFELCYNIYNICGKQRLRKKTRNAGSRHTRSAYWLCDGRVQYFNQPAGGAGDTEGVLSRSLSTCSLKCFPSLSLHCCFIIRKRKKDLLHVPQKKNVICRLGRLSFSTVECFVNINATLRYPSVQYYSYSFCIFDVCSRLLKENAHRKDTMALYQLYIYNTIIYIRGVLSTSWESVLWWSVVRRAVVAKSYQAQI